MVDTLSTEQWQSVIDQINTQLNINIELADKEETYDYVLVSGQWQLSDEIDEFEIYLKFRGPDIDYVSLALEAFNIYFGGAGQNVDIIDSNPKFIMKNDLPGWALGVFLNSQFVNRQDKVAVYSMSQIVPTGRRHGINADGEKYAAGIRKNSVRWSDFETNGFGY